MMFTSCYRLHINEERNGYTSRREIFTRALHDITIAITHYTIPILRRCFYSGCDVKRIHEARLCHIKYRWPGSKSSAEENSPNRLSRNKNFCYRRGLCVVRWRRKSYFAREILMHQVLLFIDLSDARSI